MINRISDMVIKRVCLTMMLLSVHANAWTTVAEFEPAVAEVLTNKIGQPSNSALAVVFKGEK